MSTHTCCDTRETFLSTVPFLASWSDCDRSIDALPPYVLPPLPPDPPCSLMPCCRSSLNNAEAGYPTNDWHYPCSVSSYRYCYNTARSKKWLNHTWSSSRTHSVTHLDSYMHASSSSMCPQSNASSIRHQKCSRSIDLCSMILRDAEMLWRLNLLFLRR